MKIFLSTPISCFQTDHERAEYKKQLIDLLNALRINHTVCAEIESIGTSLDYDSPTKSIKVDLESISDCDIFIMHYPRKYPTSALVELGFALALRKRIIIIVPKLQLLPYLLQGLNAYDSNAIILEYTNIDSTCIELIRNCCLME